MGFIDETMIPGIILVVFVGILIRAFKTPLGDFFNWTRGLFSRGDGERESGGDVSLYYE